MRIFLNVFRRRFWFSYRSRGLYRAASIKWNSAPICLKHLLWSFPFSFSPHYLKTTISPYCITVQCVIRLVNLCFVKYNIKVQLCWLQALPYFPHCSNLVPALHWNVLQNRKCIVYRHFNAPCRFKFSNNSKKN